MTGTIRWKEETGEAEYLLDGEVVTESEFRQGFPDKMGAPGGHAASCWPMKSEALACHPDQVVDHNERNRSKGIGARYNADGTCVIESRGDRKKLLRLEKMHDKSGGYGD